MFAVNSLVKTWLIIVFLLGLGSFFAAEIFAQENNKSLERSPKIVNGEIPNLSKWPWIALIENQKSSTSCTGMLIHSKWVLTAAHCVDYTPDKYLSVMIGAKDEFAGEFLLVAQIVTHPRYKENVRNSIYPNNDIALLRLEKPVENAVVAKMPFNGPKDYPGGAEIAGYGQECFGSRRPGCNLVVKLLQGKTRIIPKKNCNAIFKIGANRQLICTKSVAPRYSTICYGDSGGPLVAPRGVGQSPIVIGVLSVFDIRGTFPCTKRDISAYTAIYPYRSWIARYLNS